ncbi:TonB-dependent receptor plug domain-containing protein [Phascolarctobacterium sp.]|uniref:TonB-dependent receptor plug domain-containing protein n=1 Tax=Phascolarctobacterium sp. TaxID=2049039 RepID=UPI003863C81A
MKKSEMLRNAVLLSLLVGATTGFSMAAQAEEVADSMEFAMDEYVVTASRTQTAKVDTPANVTVIDAEKIESGRYQDVSEVLKDVPGAQVIDNGSGATVKSVILNGDDRVLVMVDGRRMNLDMGTTNGNSGFDMRFLPDVSLIERIEVVKGHGGALYGSDAVGGVINIITKKADRSFGKIGMGFGSGQYRDMKAIYSFKEGKTGVDVAASKEKQGYYKYKDVVTKSTNRWPGSSKYENENVALTVRQDITDTKNLEVGFQHSKTDGTSYAFMSNTPGYVHNMNLKSDRFHAKYAWTVNDTDDGYFQIYHNEFESDDYCLSDGPSNLNEKTIGMDVQQKVTLSDNNSIVVGSSYRHTKAKNSGTYGMAPYEDNVDNVAVFVSDIWEFAPSWSLNTGARYDHHSEAGGETTLSAGLNKKFDENSHAYVNWGQVFRAPTTEDVYYAGNGVSSKDLEAETGDTWTIGYGTKIADKTDVNISYFQSDIDDAIDWYNDKGNYTVRNVSEQKKRGVELSVNHEIDDNWDLNASYTYVRVRNSYNNSGFVRETNYIPNIYRLGVRYHDEKWNADVTMRAGTGADKTSFVDNSYVTVDMAVNYKATTAWTLYAKGYNLFNRAYAERGGVNYLGTYDYPAQSRRFIVGAEYSF